MARTVSESVAITAMICAEWLDQAYFQKCAGIDDFNDFHGGAYEVRSLFLALALYLDHAWNATSPNDELGGVAFDCEFVPAILNDMLSEWNARCLIEGSSYNDSPFISDTYDMVMARARRLFFEFPEKDKAAAFDRLCNRLSELESELSAERPQWFDILNKTQLHNDYDRWKRSQPPTPPQEKTV